jgi:hypothetical protein
MCLIEEENILGGTSLETLVDIAKQTERTLKGARDLSELLYRTIEAEELLEGYASLVGYLKSTTKEVELLFYNICRVNSEVVDYFCEKIKVETTADRLRTFYIFEILEFLLQYDLSGEILVICGPKINRSIKQNFNAELGVKLTPVADKIVKLTDIMNSDDLLKIC